MERVTYEKTQENPHSRKKGKICKGFHQQSLQKEEKYPHHFWLIFDHLPHCNPRGTLSAFE